ITVNAGFGFGFIVGGSNFDLNSQINGTLTVSNLVTPASTDQRGFPRIVNGTVDIGAFESQGFTLSVVSGDSQHATVSTAFASPLVVQVTANTPVERVNGGQVVSTAPGIGATASLAGSPATISGGQASVTAKANTIAGSYAVTAAATGGGPAKFSLTNSADA